MRDLPSDSVDSVITDPPAAISFMGRKWDNERGGRVGWISWFSARMAEAYRVSRPGSYALVWALPRTSHWTATAIEDAGWKIRDRVSEFFSVDAIGEAFRDSLTPEQIAMLETILESEYPSRYAHLFGTGFPKAKSCLKPGAEDWWLAYKPGGPMAPLQIDACRIGVGEVVPGGGNGKGNYRYGDTGNYTSDRPKVESHVSGRWPANVVLDEEAAAILDEMSGDVKGAVSNGIKKGNGYGGGYGLVPQKPGYADSGGASRFFYTAKASKSDRGPDNTHPTVKSEALMRWLCRLITPPGGTILDHFMGSGSTGKAAVLEGFGFIGIEDDSEPGSFETATRRINQIVCHADPAPTVVPDDPFDDPFADI